MIESARLDMEGVSAEVHKASLLPNWLISRLHDVWKCLTRASVVGPGVNKVFAPRGRSSFRWHSTFSWRGLQTPSLPPAQPPLVRRHDCLLLAGRSREDNWQAIAPIQACG